MTPAISQWVEFLFTVKVQKNTRQLCAQIQPRYLGEFNWCCQKPRRCRMRSQFIFQLLSFYRILENKLCLFFPVHTVRPRRSIIWLLNN